MPRLLPDRCRQDSIGEFRAAAERRFAEGLALDRDGHRTGAIYLWGYAAEMVLKAAYFQLVGFGPDRPITTRDRRLAQQGATLLGIGGFSSPHDIGAWAELLIAKRKDLDSPYPRTGFKANVLHYATAAGTVWTVELRYHPNRAYEFEVRRVREAVRWLLDHKHRL